MKNFKIGIIWGMISDLRSQISNFRAAARRFAGRRALRTLLLAALTTFGAPAIGSTIITATVTVTNTAGTTNGQTITVNADTRTWTNSVSIPSTQILTNNSIGGCATNLFNAVSLAPFANLSLALSGTNGITLQTVPNGAVSVSLSAGWGTVSYTTNTLTSAIVLRLPISVEAAGQQTNLASMLTTALEKSTNSLSATAIHLLNYMALSTVQTVTGAKIFASFGGTAGSITNAQLLNPNLTNGVNHGNPFSSVGSTSGSEQFGISAAASGTRATAVGDTAQASGQDSVALGYGATASVIDSTALGTGSLAADDSATAVGAQAAASAPNSTAIGTFASANYTNSTAIGYNSENTANNQVMLGASGIDVTVNEDLSVGRNIVQARFTGTNGVAGDIAFPRYALSSLANGNNAGVQVGTNVFVEVSGPTGAFTVNGINGQPNRDGKFLILLNLTGQNMTIAHDSGVEPTAANRIYTMTGADTATTGNGAAMLIYNSSSSRWILLNLSQ